MPLLSGYTGPDLVNDNHAEKRPKENLAPFGRRQKIGVNAQRVTKVLIRAPASNPRDSHGSVLRQRPGPVSSLSLDADGGLARGHRLRSGRERAYSAAKPRGMRAEEKLRATLKDGEWEAMFQAVGHMVEGTVVAVPNSYGSESPHN